VGLFETKPKTLGHFAPLLLALEPPKRHTFNTVISARQLRFVIVGPIVEVGPSRGWQFQGMVLPPSFDSGVTLLSRNVRLDNELCGLFACDTGLALVACLIASLRAWDWRRIPGRLLLNSQRS